MTDPNLGQEGRVPIWRAALFGLCPVCNAPQLFVGPIALASRCEGCGQDFSGNNVGDGPAAFLTMVIGALVIALAISVEIWLHPPFWLHALIWVPFTITAILIGLRAAKGLLFHAEFQRRAREGRLVEDDNDE